MWATVFAHRMQESLSLPTFKRKQLRQGPYPSRPPPPLGTSFLLLSRTDSQYFLSSVKTHLYSMVFSPHHLPPHQLFLSLSFPFLFPTLVCYSLLWQCPLILYPATNVTAGTRTQTHTHKTPMYLFVSSFYPGFSHFCTLKRLILIQLINHLKSSELTEHAYTNTFLT